MVTVHEYNLSDDERFMKQASSNKVASLVKRNKEERYHEKMKELILEDYYNNQKIQKVGRFTMITV